MCVRDRERERERRKQQQPKDANGDTGTREGMDGTSGWHTRDRNLKRDTERQTDRQKEK